MTAAHPCTFVSKTRQTKSNHRVLVLGIFRRVFIDGGAEMAYVEGTGVRKWLLVRATDSTFASARLDTDGGLLRHSPSRSFNDGKGAYERESGVATAEIVSTGFAASRWLSGLLPRQALSLAVITKQHYTGFMTDIFYQVVAHIAGWNHLWQVVISIDGVPLPRGEVRTSYVHSLAFQTAVRCPHDTTYRSHESTAWNR